jgi:polysaccharide export outer membrane protein
MLRREFDDTLDGVVFGAVVGAGFALAQALVFVRDLAPVAQIASLTPAQAGHTIEQALKGKALQPQVVVTQQSTEINLVTVGGDVGHPGDVPLTVRGERVLDVVAAAGGNRHEAYDCDVHLLRDGRVAAVNLRRIVDDPSENVRVRPGDNLFVSYNPRSYSVLGSALKPAHYVFDYKSMTLAEALAQSGGGADSLTNIGGIYLLRYEPRGLIQRILPPDDPRQADLAHLAPNGNYPVAFHVNLRHAQDYFLAEAVRMRNKDTILMTNAGATELTKLLGILRGFTGVYFHYQLNGTSGTGVVPAP